MKALLQLGDPPARSFLDEMGVAAVGKEFLRGPIGDDEEGGLLRHPLQVVEHVVEAFGLDVLEDIGARDDVGGLGRGGQPFDRGIVVADREAERFLERPVAAAVVEDVAGLEHGDQLLDRGRPARSGKAIDALGVQLLVEREVFGRDLQIRSFFIGAETSILIGFSPSPRGPLWGRVKYQRAGERVTSSRRGRRSRKAPPGSRTAAALTLAVPTTRQDTTAAAELAHSPYLRPRGRVRVGQSSPTSPSCLASRGPLPRDSPFLGRSPTGGERL